jgi:hypothetical protein
LNFFEELPVGERDTLANSLIALRVRYVNPNRQMVNRVTFHNRKFNPEVESIEDYIVVLKKLVVPSYEEAERDTIVR